MPENRSEARLEFNDDQGRRIVRIDKDVFTVGRRTGQDLQLTGNEVSRDHAEMVFTDGRYLLRDKESRFGTFVNGERSQSASWPIWIGSASAQPTRR